MGVFGVEVTALTLPPAGKKSVSICHAMILIKVCQMVPKKSVLRCKYVGYIHQINTIVLSILSDVRRAQLHLSSTIIVRISLFVNVIYSFSALH